MTRILSKVSSPRRPWRKGVLAFALACLTLWGSMLIAGQMMPPIPKQEHIYDLSGAAWRGIDRVEFQDLDSGQVVLNPTQAGSIISRGDDRLSPRLQLRRQGNTLIISPMAQPQDSGQTTARKKASASIRTIYLPSSVHTIQGQYLRVSVDDQSPQALPQLHLIGNNISASGAGVEHLRIELQDRVANSASAKTATKAASTADCRRNPYMTEAQLTLNLEKVGQMDITAPDFTEIRLNIHAQAAAGIGAIKLQTGAASRLNLQSLALFQKIVLTLPPAEQVDSSCAPEVAHPPAYEGDDYSD